ncbi:3'(2'),5'-bisphosphate nucleotidase CysQ [Sphingobium subterraneum]|uniref:Myo-inositol-1(Or 4)-monophosphatase n=1 Tax=Sphingobium subterraneum TaxID=627688 RepID=A0A841J6P6_9SPHN|nr:myo-inositol-1(or 4)-monophosphatase [Sphingobium subterraneum]
MADRAIRPLIDAVSEAADHALTLWAGGKTRVERWEKSPGEPVCEADIAVNHMLRASLRAIDPDAGWLSEETVDNQDRLSTDRLWVVDPIDGTRDYLGGRPGWAVSVALVQDGEAIIGILAAPARNELWVAQAGQGARRNGTLLSASGRTRLPGARVPSDVLPRADSDLRTVHKPNSIALRMAMVAADEADLVATIRWGNEWDIAASALIAQEAGATVTDALGGKLRFNRPVPSAFGVLCCAPAIHDAAVERLRGRVEAVLAKE